MRTPGVAPRPYAQLFDEKLFSSYTIATASKFSGRAGQNGNSSQSSSLTRSEPSTTRSSTTRRRLSQDDVEFQAGLTGADPAARNPQDDHPSQRMNFGDRIRPRSVPVLNQLCKSGDREPRQNVGHQPHPDRVEDIAAASGQTPRIRRIGEEKEVKRRKNPLAKRLRIK